MLCLCGVMNVMVMVHAIRTLVAAHVTTSGMANLARRRIAPWSMVASVTIKALAGKMIKLMTTLGLVCALGHTLELTVARSTVQHLHLIATSLGMECIEPKSVMGTVHAIMTLGGATVIMVMVVLIVQ